jgi:hypothetical protein
MRRLHADREEKRVTHANEISATEATGQEIA